MAACQGLCFRGRARGRGARSRPRARAIRWVHRSAPKGQLRARQRRGASSASFLRPNPHHVKENHFRPPLTVRHPGVREAVALCRLRRRKCADRAFVVPPSGGSRTPMPSRAHYERTAQPAPATAPRIFSEASPGAAPIRTYATLGVWAGPEGHILGLAGRRRRETRSGGRVQVRAAPPGGGRNRKKNS